MTRARPAPTTVLLTVAAVLAASYLLLPSGPVAETTYLVVTTLGAVVAALGVTGAADSRRPALLIAIALGLSATGDLVWTVIAWSGGDPDPSAADLFYLAGYVALGTALVVLLMPLQGRRRVVDAESVIDILTVVTVCVLVLWELLVRDIVADGTMGTFLGETALVYPIVDGILVGLVLRAMTDRVARRTLGLTFGAGIACWMLADFGYLVRDAGDQLSTATNALWMLGTLLIAHATTRLGAPTPARVGERDQGWGAGARLAVAVVPLSVPPLLVVVEEVTGRDPESWSLVVGILVLIVLALLRTERLLATEQRIRRELAVTRDAALEASRAKSEFLAGISHEVRTPMNGVLGLSRLLASTDLDDHQRQYVQGIERAGESLMSLLNDVLDFAKSEDGRISVDAIDFDLVEVVEDVASMVAEQAHRQGLELVASCSPELPRSLNGDPTKLRQVLLNFASNAVRFTSSGEVVIRASLDRTDRGDRVLLEVADTGIGIDPAEHDRLFEAFTQVGPAREPAGTTRSLGGTSLGGTGLGLAIARGLAQAMGGEVGVRSGTGRGSTFWCTVPLVPARQQIVVTRPTRAVPGSRVLVVDAHESTRRALAERLATWGLVVDHADGADAALAAMTTAAAEGTPYALVLLDLHLPGGGGLALADRVRATPALAATALIVLGSGPEVPAERLRALDIRVGLAKPVQVSRLQGAVQRALGDADRASDESTAAAPMGRGVVLVVEDSEVNQMVAVGTLRQLGYLAEIAINGVEAVEMVSTANYDAVLMDCRMPVMDGYQAATLIRRAEPPGRRVPIIAVTASAVRGDRERCLEAGMDDHLVKPLSRQLLADRLAYWVPTPAQL